MNLKKKLERYLLVNLLGPGPRLLKKKEFTGPGSHKVWEILIKLFPLENSPLNKRIPPTLPRPAIYSWITISVSVLRIWQRRTSCNKRMKQQTKFGVYVSHVRSAVMTSDGSSRVRALMSALWDGQTLSCFHTCPLLSKERNNRDWRLL